MIFPNIGEGFSSRLPAGVSYSAHPNLAITLAHFESDLHNQIMLYLNNVSKNTCALLAVLSNLHESVHEFYRHKQNSSGLPIRAFRESLIRYHLHDMQFLVLTSHSCVYVSMKSIVRPSPCFMVTSSNLRSPFFRGYHEQVSTLDPRIATACWPTRNRPWH